MSQQPVRRTQIIDAAISILATEGLEALNMRRLAADLRLRPMALYYYVPNKTALLSMVLAEMSYRVDWTVAPGPPRDRMIDLAMLQYTSFGNAPWLVEVMRAGITMMTPPLPLGDAFVSAANELGIADEPALALWRSTWMLVAAELLWHQPVADDPSTNTHPQANYVFDSIDPEYLAHTPTMARIAPHWNTYFERFDLRVPITALIDGTIAQARG
ncbi:MAG: TetR family transcriptional regulator [Gordonia sp. (in: high G+C Gram-positive bacteria)]